MDIKPIRNEADYREALKQIEGLMGARADTPEGDMLDVPATLIEAYERRAFSPNPAWTASSFRCSVFARCA